MNYTIIVFRSRNDTMKFYNLIKNSGQFCSIINTPRILSKSCGISVRISNSIVGISLKLLSQQPFPTFDGIYSIKILNGREIASRIV